MEHSYQTSDVLESSRFAPTEPSGNDVGAQTVPQIGRAPEAGTTDALILANGTPVRFRGIDADDGDRLAGLFARLSPDSRLMRFMSPKRELTPADVAYFTAIDHIHHEAIAAIDQRDGSIVGVCRYVHYADGPKVAELAIEVADELQRMGVGSALAQRIVQRARENGFGVLTATTLWVNRPARAFLRGLGFRARGSEGGEIALELDLDPPGSQPEIA
jgi:RimJ/RimL family protein N-acetyltransferase